FPGFDSLSNPNLTRYLIGRARMEGSNAAVDRRGAKPGAGPLPRAAAMEAQRVFGRVGAPDAGAGDQRRRPASGGGDGNACRARSRPRLGAGAGLNGAPCRQAHAVSVAPLTWHGLLPI